MPQTLSKISINNFGTKNIYVSGTIGNDAWSGEYPDVNGVSGPVKTLDRVSKLSQALNNTLLNVVINIREGTYPILGTTANPAFYLDNSNNSIVFKSITYKSYNNETVVISGSENISYTAFTQVTAGSPIWNRLKPIAKGNVYQASVSQFDLGWVPDNWHGSFVNNSENGNVGGLPGIPDLIFNNNTMTLARWPNKTTLGSSVFSEYATISTVVTKGSNGGYPSPRVNGIFTYPSEFDSVIGGWTAAGLSAGIWLYGYWQWDWSSDVFKLLSINTATRQLTVRSNQSTYPLNEYTACDVPFPGATAVFDSNPTPRRWFAFNTLEELDSPKEYYIDRTTKMLYFWPPDTIDSTSSIKLTHRALNGAAAYTQGEFTTDNGNTGEIGFNPNTGVPATTGTGIFPYVGWTGADIQGEGYRLVSGLQSRYAQNIKNAITSLFKFYKVKNLTIDGLIFRDSAGSGIELNLCQNVTIKNCHIYNINHTGIQCMGGRNNIIDRCKIHDIGMDGIINVGGNRQTLIPANNIVTGCSIKRFALKNDTKHFGICINGVGNVASYNLIGEGSYGILQSGNNHVIEYNHLYNLIPENDDAGGIYSGRDASHFGKTIRYNFFNNVRSQLPGGTYNDGSGCVAPRTALTMAIYYDDLESYSNIYGNVFYKCGAGSGGAIFFNGGVFHTLTNNIFIECIKSVNASQYTVDFWNSTLDAQKWKIINPENFTWYDVDGGPFGPSGGICFATGYNPYTYNQTNYGQQGYQTDANRNGIMPTVNLKSDVYTTANPYYTTMYNVSGGGISLTTDVNFIKTIKNTISTNVLVKGPTGSATFVGGGSPPGGLTVGGFSMGLEMITATDPGFVGYTALNFKLTPGGLATVQAVLPTFVDIPFQYIPTLSYNPLTPDVEAINGIEVVTDTVNLSFNTTERAATIPPMLANSIKYGQLLYETAGLGANFTVDPTAYKTSVQSTLAPFYGNTLDKNYFGNYPYHLVLDYETDITNYINGDVDPIAGSSCAKAINLLNNLLIYTKEVSPNSIVYEYNCPTLPYYFAFTEGNACTWAEKSGAVSGASYEAEKTRLRTQQQSKIALFKDNTDRLDIAAYPTYSDAFEYAKSTDAATSQLTYNNTLSARQALLNNYPKTVPTQIFSTFQVFAGSEYLLTGTASNSITGYTGLQNYQSLVSSTPHLGTYNFKPATDTGVKKMFIWYPLQYVINIAKLQAKGVWGVTAGNSGIPGSSIYEARKVLNDLWCDTQTIVYTVPETALSSYTYRYTLPIDNDDVWRGTTGIMPPSISGLTANVQDRALQAGISKTVQMARLFKSYAGDSVPLTQDCATVISRGSTYIQGLTAYTGNLSYIPYNPDIFVSTDTEIVAVLQNASNNYLPALPAGNTANRYTRAYKNADVPDFLRQPITRAPLGSMSNCSNPMITQTLALTQSDVGIGQWLRTAGLDLAFDWKVVNTRVANGRPISPGTAGSQATALATANNILTEVATHVPFERFGWTLSECEFKGYTDGYRGFEPVNDGKFSGTAWYIKGIIDMMTSLGTAGMTTGIETKLKGVLEGEVYGLVANWKENLGWYTKGQLTGLPPSAGQPNTNQWIDPAGALINLTLYLGDKKFLPAYNLGVALLAESFNYEHDDGSFLEGFGYAQQSVTPMINTANYAKASGDSRLTGSGFLQNYWQWAQDNMLPGNHIINCSDNRGGQAPDYVKVYYWPSIIEGALASGNTALANAKYLYPPVYAKVLKDEQAIRYIDATKGITAALTMPNYKFYSGQQMTVWRTGRDRPSEIGNPLDPIGSQTFGNTATPHYAIWAKGSSLKEGHKHTDQGQISVYQGYKVILMDCGIDYDASNPNLINPLDTLQQATGHNMMQVDAVDKSVPVNAPMTVTTLGATGGNLTINGTCAYTKINNCTRNIIWGATAYNTPLTVTISDTFNKTTGVTVGVEVYRFHTGNTNGISISGSGTGWTASWANVTMGFTSNFSIIIGQTGFNDFTQLVPTAIQGTTAATRVHKMLNISAGVTIAAGNTFSLTTTLIVSP